MYMSSSFLALRYMMNRHYNKDKHMSKSTSVDQDDTVIPDHSKYLFTLLYPTSLDADLVRRDLILLGRTNCIQRACCLLTSNCELHCLVFCFPTPLTMMIYFLFNHDGQHNHFH